MKLISSIIFPQLHEVVSKLLTVEEEENLYKICGYVVFKLKDKISKLLSYTSQLLRLISIFN